MVRVCGANDQCRHASSGLLLVLPTPLQDWSVVLVHIRGPISRFSVLAVCPSCLHAQHVTRGPRLDLSAVDLPLYATMLLGATLTPMVLLLDTAVQ